MWSWKSVELQITKAPITLVIINCMKLTADPIKITKKSQLDKLF